METKLLYMDDSYLREFEAKVLSVKENRIILDQTAFYPKGGGLPSDTGVIKHPNGESKVTFVGKEGNLVFHQYEGEPPEEGQVVKGIIDWDKRYRIMRLHTSAHILSGLLYSETGALITGGNIKLEKGHLDFSLERTDRELLEGIVKKANELIKEGREVKIYYMDREKVLSTPGLVKLAEKLPPALKTLRIVEIEGIDIQADGGPHVKNISEIGEIILLKIENKGRNRKRLYYTVP